MNRLHTQTLLHDPEAGVMGNCMQAAVATLLGLDMDDVPHFAAMAEDEWQDAFTAWLFTGNLLWVVLDVEYVPEGMPCLLSGPSPRGVDHLVVGVGAEMVFDPHPSRAGLVSIDRVWVLAPFLPWEPTSPPVCICRDAHDDGTVPALLLRELRSRWSG